MWLAGNDLRLTLLAVPPVLPLIHADLHLDEKGVAALSGLPVLLLGIAAVPGSLLIARIGPRRALISGLCLIAAGALVIVRLRKRQETQTPSKLLIGAVAVGILALLIAPSTWSFYKVFQDEGGGGMLAAGPQPAEGAADSVPEPGEVGGGGKCKSPRSRIVQF